MTDLELKSLTEFSIYFQLELSEWMVDWKRNAISWFDFNGMKAAQGIYLLSHPPNWLKVPINSNQWNSDKTHILGGFEDRTRELLQQEFINSGRISLEMRRYLHILCLRRIKLLHHRKMFG